MTISQINCKWFLALAWCFAIALISAEAARGDLLLGENRNGTIEIQTYPSTVQNLATASLFSPFDIVLNFNDIPTFTEAAAFAAAESTWESIITGYKQSVASTTLTITVNLDPIDGPGSILGSAGPTTAKITPAYLYASSGTMTFDTADTSALATAGLLNAVILHEMAHVIGVGTLWSASAVTGGAIIGRQELYVANSGQYTGAYGLQAYNSEFGQTGTFVPVELGGGPGTANAHWNEVNGGSSLTGITNGLGQDMAFELMTGWLNSPAFISSLTIQGMQDLGYNVAAIPEVPSFALMLVPGSIVLLSAGRRYLKGVSASRAPMSASEISDT